jgi:three-Cys-motif partner protein
MLWGLQQIRGGSHSIEKIRLHNYYVSLFTTAMKSRWPQRAYLGLYSGSGRARVRDSGQVIETTAMGALRARFPFTKYIFVDNDSRCIEALEQRVHALDWSPDASLFERDVIDAVPDIHGAMPRFGRGKGLLSFCFVDPFSANLDFRVIRELGSRYRMDFLVLLMLGVDVRQNFRRYFDDPSDTRIGSLIDDPGWREEWKARNLRRRDLIGFVLQKFDAAMTSIGYTAARPDEAHPIRVMGKHVFLYSLVLYSKSDLGRKFWQTVRQGVDPQRSLDL